MPATRDPDRIAPTRLQFLLNPMTRMQRRRNNGGLPDGDPVGQAHGAQETHVLLSKVRAASGGRSCLRKIKEMLLRSGLPIGDCGSQG